jgi:hypothetical protein
MASAWSDGPTDGEFSATRSQSGAIKGERGSVMNPFLGLGALDAHGARLPLVAILVVNGGDGAGLLQRLTAMGQPPASRGQTKEGERLADLQRNGVERSAHRGTLGGETPTRLRWRRGGSSGMRGDGGAVQQ